MQAAPTFQKGTTNMAKMKRLEIQLNNMKPSKGRPPTRPPPGGVLIKVPVLVPTVIPAPAAATGAEREAPEQGSLQQEWLRRLRTDL